MENIREMFLKIVTVFWNKNQFENVEYSQLILCVSKYFLKNNLYL